MVERMSSLNKGAVGCDLTAPLNSFSAQNYANRGFSFVIRYVGRKDGVRTFVDLTQSEAEAIIGAGLALGVVQHPLGEGWSPTGELGTRFGTAAAELCAAAALPAGMTVWCDLEGVNAASAPADVIGYCNAWYASVTAAGFAPGVYIGANPGLTADQLYWNLRFKAYWRGGSSASAGVPADLPHRGYQMAQSISGSGGSEFDRDVVLVDHMGDTPSWCVQ